MEEIYNFLNDAGTYFLATDDNGQPRVRPFGTVALKDGKLYIQTGKSKDVFKQIQKNPKVEISAFKDGKWIRVTGELENDDSVEAKKFLLDQYPDLAGMYSPTDDNTAVLYFKNGEAVISSFTDEPIVIPIA